MKKIQTEDWAFFPSTQILEYNDGKLLELPSRLSNCLDCLIQARGDTVDYDTLLLSVWKTTHREASTISSVISELRKLIKCESGKYIKTVPKKGYRFIGQFVASDSDELSVKAENTTQPAESIAAPNTDTTKAKAEIASSNSPASPLIVSSPPGENRAIDAVDQNQYQVKQSGLSAKKAVLSTSIFIVVAIAAFWLIQSRFLIESNHYTPSLNDIDYSGKPTENESGQLESILFSSFEILTHEQGVVSEFTVSPSDDWLVFTNQGALGGVKKLKAKSLINGDIQTLDSEEGDVFHAPSFSHAGDKVVYVKYTPDNCEIRTIGFSSTGFDSSQDNLVTSCGSYNSFSTPIFSLDDSTIYFSRASSVNEPHRLVRHDIDTKEELERTLPTVNGAGDYSFSLSPDGQYISIIRNIQWTKSSIQLFNIALRETEELVLVENILLSTTWLDSETIVYKSKSDELLAVNIHTKESRLIKKRDLDLFFPVVEKGDVFAIRGRLFSTQINIFDLNEVISTNAILSPFTDFFPIVIDDTVYFTSYRSGTKQIWQKKGDKELKLTNLPEDFVTNTFLYDSTSQKFILLSESTLYWFDPENQKLEFLYEFDKVNLNMDIDSATRTLLITQEEQERWYIYRLDLDDLSQERLVRGFTAKIRNGFLYFSKYGQKGLYKHDMTTEKSILVYADFDIDKSDLWDLVGTTLVFVENDSFVKVDLNTQVSQKSERIGDVRKISCVERAYQCYYDLYGLGTANIVKLK